MTDRAAFINMPQLIPKQINSPSAKTLGLKDKASALISIYKEPISRIHTIPLKLKVNQLSSKKLSLPAVDENRSMTAQDEPPIKETYQSHTKLETLYESSPKRVKDLTYRNKLKFVQNLQEKQGDAVKLMSIMPKMIAGNAELDEQETARFG